VDILHGANPPRGVVHSVACEEGRVVHNGSVGSLEVRRVSLASYTRLSALASVTNTTLTPISLSRLRKPSLSVDVVSIRPRRADPRGSEDRQAPRPGLQSAFKLRNRQTVGLVGLGRVVAGHRVEAVQRAAT